MSATAIIGTDFTFQALFRDTDGTPLAVTTPLITVFYFDNAGARQDEVVATAMVAPTPAEVGRYVHAYTIPSTFEHGETLQVEMTGIHPGSGDTLYLNESLQLQSAAYLQSGLIASFIG